MSAGGRGVGDGVLHNVRKGRNMRPRFELPRTTPPLFWSSPYVCDGADHKLDYLCYPEKKDVHKIR